MKAKRYGPPIPLRIPQKTTNRISLCAERYGLSMADVMRMALYGGLPQVEAGLMARTTTTTTLEK